MEGSNVHEVALVPLPPSLRLADLPQRRGVPPLLGEETKTPTAERVRRCNAVGAHGMCLQPDHRTLPPTSGCTTPPGGGRRTVGPYRSTSPMTGSREAA